MCGTCSKYKRLVCLFSPKGNPQLDRFTHLFPGSAAGRQPLNVYPCVCVFMLDSMFNAYVTVCIYIYMCRHTYCTYIHIIWSQIWVICVRALTASKVMRSSPLKAKLAQQQQSLRRKRSVAVEKHPPNPICESVGLRRKVEPVQCCWDSWSCTLDLATQQKHIPQSESNLFLPQ